MDKLSFQWDPRKARANAKKHGVSFEEAQSAFYDERAIEFCDPDHSEAEDRFLLLGLSSKHRELVVCHCFRDTEFEIRVISARKATKSEAEYYWQRRS